MSVLVNDTSISVELLWIHRVLSVSSVAAITLNFYDWLLTFSDERRYIWSNWRLNIYMKVIFLIMRYFPLGIQLTLDTWGSWFLSSYPVSELVCNRYHALVVSSLVIQLNALDCFLILRAWLLSNRGKTALFLLMMIIITQLCGLVMSFIKLLSHLSMNGLCMIDPPLSTYGLSWLTGLIVHTSSWAYTMHQCRRARKRGWGKTPIVWLLERDGSLCWISFIGIVAMGVIFGHLYSTVMSPIIVPWIVTSVSIMGCRMILNMQHLADKGTKPEDVSIGVELTTNIQICITDLPHSNMETITSSREW